MRAVRALLAHNERLLDAVRAGTPGRELAALMRLRADRVQTLAAALAGGEALSAEEAQLLQHGERELRESLESRRDEVARALSALHHARLAERTYQAPRPRAPRFVDRSG